MLRSMAWRSVSEGFQLNIESTFSIVLQCNAAFDVAEAFPLQLGKVWGSYLYFSFVCGILARKLRCWMGMRRLGGGIRGRTGIELSF